MEPFDNSKYQIFEKKNNKGKKIAIAILVVLLMFGSFGIGAIYSQKSELVKNMSAKQAGYIGSILNKYGFAPKDKLSQDVDFSQFWSVWDILKNEYVDKGKLTDKQMFYGALRGLVSSANDPYTVFMEPKVAQEFADDLAGTFEGIGAEIGMKNEVITIVAPLSGMPAEKAGLKAGDKILAINGESTNGLSVDEAVNKIRGPKGTEVTLSIYRNGFEKAKDYKITRDVIVVKSVKTEMRKDGIFVITVSNFNDDTKELFANAVREIAEKNPKGIILDLRNNPGGYLDTAVDMASQWVEDGVIVTEQFSEDKKNEYPARGRADLKNYPTVVLVNQGSASASEIVSGALKDYQKATIVGMKTFGKGSVQTLEELNDGSSLKITIAKWLTPKGNNINEQGIAPDVEVDLTNDDYNNSKDPQLDKAVELLTKGKK